MSTTLLRVVVVVVVVLAALASSVHVDAHTAARHARVADDVVRERARLRAMLAAPPTTLTAAAAANGGCPYGPPDAAADQVYFFNLFTDAQCHHPAPGAYGFFADPSYPGACARGNLPDDFARVCAPPPNSNADALISVYLSAGAANCTGTPTLTIAAVFDTCFSIVQGVYAQGIACSLQSLAFETSLFGTPLCGGAPVGSVTCGTLSHGYAPGTCCTGSGTGTGYALKQCMSARSSLIGVQAWLPSSNSGSCEPNYISAGFFVDNDQCALVEEAYWVKASATPA